MKRKTLLGLLALEAVACVVLALSRSRLPGFFTVLAAFPLEQIGFGLRALSLSGPTGNIAAILLYVLLGLLPLLLLRRRIHSWQDCLPVLLSGTVFLALYCMINPGILSQWAGNPLGSALEKYMLGGLFYTLLVSIVVLRLLRSFYAADQARLRRYLVLLLGCLSALLVFLAFGSGFAGLLDSLDALREANQGSEDLLGWTQVFLMLQFAVETLPYLLDLWIVDALAAPLTAERHSDQSLQAADRLSHRCGAALTALIAANLGFQLLQLLFVQRLLRTSSTVQLPLLSLLFVLAALLLSQLLRENKQLKDDADLFI